ncbi:MAG: hypothetical protein AAGD06_33755, partial [Acidobacteriota bacterium]
LYPSVILYGGDGEARRALALDFARALLCSQSPGDPEPRGCDPDDADACTHCRRLLWPEKGAERFHPDLHVLERDLRTATSVDATKGFLRGAYSAPFEAGGQVFVVAEADSLSAGAADALLKLLEEPPERTPRHFLLLAASRLDLLPTLRSRSLSVYLGHRGSLDDDSVQGVLQALEPCLDGFFEDPLSAIHLLMAADALGGAGGFEDPRNRQPWAIASSAVLRYLHARATGPRARRGLLALASALLDAPRLRLRGIPHGRILEGLVARHLAAP